MTIDYAYYTAECVTFAFGSRTESALSEYSRHISLLLSPPSHRITIANECGKHICLHDILSITYRIIMAHKGIRVYSYLYIILLFQYCEYIKRLIMAWGKLMCRLYNTYIYIYTLTMFEWHFDLHIFRLHII